MSKLRAGRFVSFLLLGSALLVVVGGAAYVRTELRTGDGKAGVTMALERGITQVIGVSEGPHAAAGAPSRVSAAPPGGKLMTLMPKRETMSLEELKARMGTLVVPTYLPQGFALEETYYERDRLAKLVYRRGEQQVSVIHDTYPPRVQVKKGFFRAVSIGPRQGYVVDGSWLMGPGGASEWSRGLLSMVYLDWDELFVRIEVVRPASVFTGAGITFPLSGVESEIDEAELIKIAESLQPY